MATNYPGSPQAFRQQRHLFLQDVRPFVAPQVDKALRYKGYCTGDNGAYVCTQDMMGLCNTYLKN